MSDRRFIRHIKGTLEIVTPLHVGGGQSLHPLTDQPYLRIDGRPDGAPVIYGSSIKGVLHSFLEREAPLLGVGQKALDNLFGFSRKKPSPSGPSQDRQDDDNQESDTGRLIVRDSVCSSPLFELPDDVRDHVRISHETGAAQDTGKFDEEITAPGLCFPLHLIYAGDGPDDPELLLVKSALEALARGDLRIGAKSNRGYGAAKLGAEVACRDFQRSEPSGLSAYLKFRLAGGGPLIPATIGSIPWPKPKTSPAASASASSWYTFQLNLRFDGPVLVKSTIPPSQVPNSPEPGKYEEYAAYGRYVSDFVFMGDKDGTPYIPGTSLRGVLRWQAARICASQGIPDAVWELLFGSKLDTVNGNVTGHKGLLEIRDASLVDAPRYAYLDHVAIDRITGFAKQRAKFDASCLDSPEFKVIVRLTLCPGNLAQAALWMFLLRDLQKGRLWFGSGVTRGYGRLHSADARLLEASLADAAMPAPPDIPRHAGRQQIDGQPADDFRWFHTVVDAEWQRLPRTVPPQAVAE